MSVNETTAKPRDVSRKVQPLVRCPYCDGTGNEGWPQDYYECVECGGSGKLQLTEKEVRKTCKGCHNLNNSPTKWWCDVRGKKTNGHPKQICIRGFEDKIVQNLGGRNV